MLLLCEIISEDVLTGEVLIGDYTINPSSDGRTTVTVYDGAGAVVYNRQVGGEGKFAHTAAKPGEYKMCFTNTESNTPKTVNLAISSGKEKKLAEKSNLKPLEMELKRLEESIIQIHQEMSILQAREIQMREINGETEKT